MVRHENYYNEVNAAVGATFEDVTDEIRPQGPRVLALVEVQNTGETNAITDFQLLIKSHTSGSWFVAITGSDWDAVIADIMPWISGDPVGLAAAGSCAFKLQLGAVHSFKFQAKSASGTSSAVLMKVVSF